MTKLKTILKLATTFKLAIVPLKHRSKEPAVAGGVHAATTDPKDLTRYFSSHPDANYGIATGGKQRVIVLDVDGEVGKESLQALVDKHGALPKTPTVRTSKGGRHYYFRGDEEKVRNSAGVVAPGLDIRADGGYAVGPGSTHPDGTIYDFVPGRGFDELKIARMPRWLRRKLRVKAQPRPTVTNVEVPPEEVKRATSYVQAAFTRELERLGKAPTHQRNATLNTCSFKIGQLLPYGLLDGGTVVKGLTQVATRIGLDQAEIEPTIRSGLTAGRAQPRKIPFIKTKQQTPAKKGTPQAELDLNLAEKLAKLGQTDTDNAQRFAAQCADKIIYTPGRGFLVFDGQCWQADALHQTMELAKHTARSIALETQYIADPKEKASRAQFCQSSLSKSALDRMLELSKSLVAVEDVRLDANPWLLNTQTGTIDLRTGRKETHDPRDLITKVVPVAADRHAECPRFKRFIKQITGDDKELARYIQKAIGYTLTGDTTEQVFFFCYGKSGNNGKSTLVNLIRDMLGPYGCNTPTETLMAKQYDNAIPSDIARLAGARMVTAIEATHSKHLDEAKLKAMTGGEKLTARFMRQDYFEFLPEFKLWFVANDRPRVRGTDTALWRRADSCPSRPS